MYQEQLLVGVLLVAGLIPLPASSSQSLPVEPWVPSLHEDVHPSHYHPRLAIGVQGDSVLVQRSKLGEREYVFEYSLRKEGEVELVSGDLFPDRAPLAQSFAARGGTVGFFDADQRSSDPGGSGRSKGGDLLQAPA